MRPRPTIDVTDLTPIAFDARTTVWWGNTLMIFIETTTVALLVVSYFYTRQNFPEWPPPRVDEWPVIARPVPDLGVATVNTVLLLVTCVPMAAADWAARQRGKAVVLIGLAGLTVLGGVAIALRWQEFAALKVRWDANAYGSTVWAILVLHLFYLVLAAAECGYLAVSIYLYGLDDRHAVDTTLTAVYWYWTVGVWVVLYGVVYWSPRIL